MLTTMKLFAFGLALGACAADAPCPDGTRVEAQTLDDLDYTFCVDAAGLAHGPWHATSTANAATRADGAFYRGSADGVWRYRFEDGDTVRYRQEFKRGLRHGLWEERDRQGAVLATQHFERGRRCGAWLTADPVGLVGLGAVEPRLEGDYPACDALPEPAPAPAVDPADAPPTRAIVTGTANVVGALELVGEHVAGAPEGRWVAFLDGHAIHEWHYHNGLRHGLERRWFTLEDGGRLAERGAWTHGQRSGEWQSYAPSGHASERGAYVDGRRHGLWERLVGDQVVEATTYKNGERHGDYSSAYDDGTPECAGGYADDLRTGHWICHHANHAISAEGDYTRGARTGRFFGQSPDGLSGGEGNFVEGVPDGEWRTWATSLPGQVEPPEEGKVVLLQTWRNGAIEGMTEAHWESDGALHSRAEFVGGVRHGAFESFYRNGNPAETGPFVSGAQQGLWRYHYREGALHIEATWFKGVLHGPYREYWPNGQLKESGRYRDDEPLEITRYAEDGSPLP